MRTSNATPPQEVWQKIVSHLGVRDWAQVSGTCKATWNMELQDVRISGCDRLGNAGKAQQSWNVLWYVNSLLLSH